jgi:hypothetical protein
VINAHELVTTGLRDVLLHDLDGYLPAIPTSFVRDRS